MNRSNLIRPYKKKHVSEFRSSKSNEILSKLLFMQNCYTILSVIKKNAQLSLVFF